MHMLRYLNPVFPHDFPDPFVLKVCGEYWAYCSGLRPDGGAFGILRSRDLVNWQAVGSAMTPLPGDFGCYWAPEAIIENGMVYLYYSVGDEATMQIRVAVADNPAGPFVDSGRRLTQEPFAIDAHVFTAPDGRRYLFYATDYLEHERVGTGTAVDEMLDLFTLAGRPRPVSRARYDWQIYDPQRAEKGGVRWHTIEGPFVLTRKGLFYQMCSGGNWQNPSYGVGYATATTLDDPDEWQQSCDGESVLPVLRTIPGEVIGPGHNSVVRGPDNRQLYCVYHRWSGGDGRQLAIDPLDWAGPRLFVLGPSYTPQPRPLLPALADWFDGPELGKTWRAAGGVWRVADSAVHVEPDAGQRATLTQEVGPLPFLVQVSARASGDTAGSYGLSLRAGERELVRIELSPQRSSGALVWPDGAADPLPLPPGFRCDAFHLLSVEVDGRQVAVSVDERPALRRRLADAPTAVALCAAGLPATFAGFALTVGWEDSFDRPDGPVGGAWIATDEGGWTVQNRQLVCDGPGEGRLRRGPALANYELVVNARLIDAGGSYGIAPALAGDGSGPWLTVEAAGGHWLAHWRDGEASQEFSLPAGFDALKDNQFRLRKEDGHLTVCWEQHLIGDFAVDAAPSHMGLAARRAAFDMARLTAIDPFESSIFHGVIKESSWTPSNPSSGQPASRTPSSPRSDPD